MDWVTVLGLLWSGQRLLRPARPVERVIKAKTVDLALERATREDVALHHAGYQRIAYQWLTSEDGPAMRISYAPYHAVRPSTAPDDLAIHWGALVAWLVGAVIAVTVATFTSVFGLYLLDIAMAGAGASRSVYGCADQACVTESWLVGGGLIIGAVAVLGGVLPMFLRSSATFRAATRLCWSATLVLLLAAVAATVSSGEGAAWLLVLPAVGAAILAIGCHARRWSRGHAPAGVHRHP